MVLKIVSKRGNSYVFGLKLHFAATERHCRKTNLSLYNRPFTFEMTVFSTVIP